MTAVRLAYHPEGGRTLSELPGGPTVPDAPSLRLALANGQAERNGSLEVSGSSDPTPEAPTVRLATAEGGIAYPGGAVFKGLTENDSPEARPALLVSYVYLTPFLKNRARYRYRDWVMDSGAFSAQRSGAVIDLQTYIDACKRLMDEDATLSEVFALDVIGDWRATVKNAEAMHRQGVPAIPCYHVGSPESVLIGLARDYPKVALGGAVGFRGKDRWAAQCFARVWPKAIHGFGFGSERSIMALPWHSVDATNWEIGACKFGVWKSFGHARLSIRGSGQNLRAEVEYYLKLERRARARWKAEMAKLPDVAPLLRLGPGPAGEAPAPPAVRLAIVSPDTASTRQLTAFSGPEAVASGPEATVPSPETPR